MDRNSPLKGLGKENVNKSFPKLEKSKYTDVWKRLYNGKCHFWPFQTLVREAMYALGIGKGSAVHCSKLAPYSFNKRKYSAFV